MNDFLLIWYKYQLQNIVLLWEVWNVDNFGIIFLGPKQSSFHRIFINNRKLKWWNLGNVGEPTNLKSNNFGNLKLFKQILLTQTYFWPVMDYFEIILNFAWVQNNRLLPGVFPKNRVLRWSNLDKSLNPKQIKQGVPSTPQHTDSHACSGNFVTNVIISCAISTMSW